MVKGTIERLRIPLSRVFVAGVIALVLLSDSAWESRWSLVGSLLFCLGIVLAGLGSMGRMWCSLYIGGRKTRTLVTEGPYSLCRHPLYFFSLVGVLGVGFTSETFLIPLILAIGFAAYYPLVIRAEENKLRQWHGPQLDQYLAAVPSFFPRLSGWNEPTQYVVNPVLFRKSLFSTLWFVWLIGAMEVVEMLHALDWVPVVLRVY